jgi:tetratricopeptide (TPR) repeat protein
MTEEAGKNFGESIRILASLIKLYPKEDDYVFQSNEAERVLANSYMRAGRAILRSAQDESSKGGLDQDRVNRAREQLTKAQEIRLTLLSREDDNPKLRPDLGKGYYFQGDLERVCENLLAAIENFKNSASVFQEVLKDDPKESEAESYLAAARRYAAELMVKNAQLQEARQCYAEESSRLDELVKENPEVPDYQLYQAYLWKSIADLEKREGKITASRDALERIRRIYAALSKRFPDVASHQRDLAVALRDLAQAEHAASDEQSAGADLRESIRLLSDLVRQFPNEVEYAELLKETQAVKLSVTAAPN